MHTLFARAHTLPRKDASSHTRIHLRARHAQESSCARACTRTQICTRRLWPTLPLAHMRARAYSARAGTVRALRACWRQCSACLLASERVAWPQCRLCHCSRRHLGSSCGTRCGCKRISRWRRQHLLRRRVFPRRARRRSLGRWRHESKRRVKPRAGWPRRGAARHGLLGLQLGCIHRRRRRGHGGRSRSRRDNETRPRHKPPSRKPLRQAQQAHRVHRSATQEKGGAEARPAHDGAGKQLLRGRDGGAALFPAPVTPPSAADATAMKRKFSSASQLLSMLMRRRARGRWAARLRRRLRRANSHRRAGLGLVPCYPIRISVTLKITHVNV